MGIATPPLPFVISYSKGHHHPIQISNKTNSVNSMSQDYHQGIFNFPNGFERSQQEQQHHQQRIAQQIRSDKLQVQGFEPPPPLVAIEEESGGLPVYETTGMLSEMFNFPPGGAATATELLESQISSSYRNIRPSPSPAAAGVSSEWYGTRQGMIVGGLGPLVDSKSQNVVNDRDSNIVHHHHHHHQISSINADSAAAMQLFLMNPQPRSPSPSPSSHPHPPATSSTLHMLLPNPPSTSNLQGFHSQVLPTASPASGVFNPSGQFTWVPDTSHEGGTTTNEIGGVVEGQGLSLSLSSSLQRLEATKAEELRMGDGGGMLYFNQGSGGSTYPYKNWGGHHQALNLQGGVGHEDHQVHTGFGPSLGVVNVLRNSKYVKAAQELLEEFCSVGRGQFKKNKSARHNTNNPNSNPSGSAGGGSSSSSKDLPPLSAADRIEHQRRKVKLLSILDEVDRRYNHYCEQMQMVVNSFDLVMGFGAAVPYTALAQKAMSRHFRCLKDAILAQLKQCCELLGEKDASTSGVTKGETPRLRLLEQSLRQQRAFHQMGMMEQEAWRPQRGLPERSVNILRAWLFEHFLHPYPSDADKHMLARHTGLSRNQVSNWFINARVRLWKPMVEEMYQQEEAEERDNNQTSGPAQTPMPSTTTATAATITTATASISTTTTPTTITATGKRSEINALDSDPSLIAINTQAFSENQAKHAIANHPSSLSTMSTTIMSSTNPTTAAPVSAMASPVAQSYHGLHESDTCRRGTIIDNDFGTPTTTSGNAEKGSTLLRFGTTAGDVSLTLGLRHAGNMPEKSPFSVRDFGGC